MRPQVLSFLADLLVLVVAEFLCAACFFSVLHMIEMTWFSIGMAMVTMLILVIGYLVCAIVEV